MQAVRGIIMPAIATMSDGKVATTKTAIEIPHISNPVREVLN
jgi:hypothetical protein